MVTVKYKKPSQMMMFLKIHQYRPIHSLLKNGWSGSLLLFFYYSSKYIKQRFTFNHSTKVSAQTFSSGRKRLIYIYLSNFDEMILIVPIQCSVAETSLNRMS